jgi:uncharacterized protein (TIGR00255 family)
MTGFGASTFRAGGAGYACAIRAVNRRTFEVAFRLPPEIQGAEAALRKRISDACVRGEISLSVERVSQDETCVAEVDEPAVRAIHQAWKRMARVTGAIEGFPLASILGNPGMVRLIRGGTDSGRLAGDVLAGVDLALKALKESREAEGRTTEAAIRECLASIARAWQQVKDEAAETNRILMAKAAQRARAIATAARVAVDDGALETAIAGLAERSDISEELARMDAHLGQMGGLLDSPPPHGRRIDFLCQEMMREANTAASKAQSAAVSHLAVEIKADIERIREQAANVL